MTPKKPPSIPISDPPVYTIEEFCEVHRLSRAFFYVLRKRGQAPDLLHAGNRVLIAGEAARAWRVAVGSPENRREA